MRFTLAALLFQPLNLTTAFKISRRRLLKFAVQRRQSLRRIHRERSQPHRPSASSGASDQSLSAVTISGPAPQCAHRLK
jgi:hypothetical protein